MADVSHGPVVAGPGSQASRGHGGWRVGRRWWLAVVHVRALVRVLLPVLILTPGAVALAGPPVGGDVAAPTPTEPSARPAPAPPSPLAIDGAMARWGGQGVGAPDPRRVVADLHRELLDRGWRQTDDLTLPAATAFARRQGDCVSFALLLAALARHRLGDGRGSAVRFAVLEPEPVQSVPGLPNSGLPSPNRADPGLEVGRGHLAVALPDGDGLWVWDAGGERRVAAGRMRLLDDAEALGIYHSNRGAAHLLAGRPRRAVAELRAATRAAPGLVAAWTNLGVALRRAGDPAAAEAAYWRAVRLAPGSTAAWRNLALLLREERIRGAAAPGR